MPFNSIIDGWKSVWWRGEHYPSGGEHNPSGDWLMDGAHHAKACHNKGSKNVLWRGDHEPWDPIGWYGFNPVSTLAFVYMKDAARCAVTTTLSACAGGATTLAIHVALKNPPDVTPALNGREAQRRLSPGWPRIDRAWFPQFEAKIWCTAVKLCFRFRLAPLYNGILAGLVSITGPCAVVDPWYGAAGWQYQNPRWTSLRFPRLKL
jgi:hypothetical protein